MKNSVNGGGVEDYLSINNTLPIKGLFVIIVFFSHWKSYVVLSGSVLDSSFDYLISQIGQLSVVMFFFYSGYGIFTSYQKKDNYMKTFLRHRFLPVYMSFVVCICFFLFENLFIGESYNWKDILLSFTGWSSVGNSNWFMFVTFSLYLLFFVCFRWIPKENEKIGLFIFTIISLVLAAALFFFKESWWYNTLMCFPLGAWYSLYKKKIDCVVMKSELSWIITFVCLLFSFIVTYFITSSIGVFYIIYSAIFALLVVIVTMKFKFCSKPLAFLGKHVFSIYILQRLVYRPLINTPIKQNIYIFFIVSLVITIFISVLYDKIFDRIRGAVPARLLCHKPVH